MDPLGSHFGIASLPLDPPTKAGPSLHTRDSLNESIAVYRSITGELQFATTVAADSAQQDSFAISPDGEVLTVLSGGQVQSFLLPGKMKTPENAQSLELELISAFFALAAGSRSSKFG